MLEAERIRENACGCRYDVATGITVYRCESHASPKAKSAKVWYRVDTLDPRGRVIVSDVVGPCCFEQWQQRYGRINIPAHMTTVTIGSRFGRVRITLLSDGADRVCSECGPVERVF